MDDGCKVLGNMYRSALMRFTSNLINSKISDTVVVGYDNKYKGLFTNYILVNDPMMQVTILTTILKVLEPKELD